MSHILPLVPFVFIRHGSTDWSFDQLQLGVIDLPLNAKGIKDIQATARRLMPVSNPIIISSPKKRTLETATLIGAEINSLVHIEPALDARYYGDFSRDLGACQRFQWALQNEDTTDAYLESLLPADAEKKGIFAERTREALSRIMRRSDFAGKFLIIVSHGEVYRSLCKSLLNEKLDIEKGDYRYFYPPKTLQTTWLVSRLSCERMSRIQS